MDNLVAQLNLMKIQDPLLEKKVMLEVLQEIQTFQHT